MYSLRSESVMKNRRDVAENNQSSNEKQRGEENGKKTQYFQFNSFFLFSAKNQNKEMKMSDILSDIIQREAKKNMPEKTLLLAKRWTKEVIMDKIKDVLQQ